ncbi:MAG: aldo/keto reductase [Bacteroidales bacterium]|nr:aldo/keto reductase [Bacteroidales bacterium]
MRFNRCGNSGVLLPALSLGLWHNFGSVDDFGVAKQMVLRAFDVGICHFDLANNYGPMVGSAEENFGRIVKTQLGGHRDELFISTKAGHEMWPGVYGGNSSRKNLIASCDQSLRRLGLDYVDVFYSHRYDGVTPIEETMQALVDIVRAGKALYVGISKYPVELQRKCYEYLQARDTPCLLSQYPASMFRRASGVGTGSGMAPADGRGMSMPTNLEIAGLYGSGFVCFSPLAQGLLTDKYLQGIPQGSRAAKPTGFLRREQVTEARVVAVHRLNALAARRGQTLAQMALAWLLHDTRVTSVIMGASQVTQLNDNLLALDNTSFGDDELKAIDTILAPMEIQM